MTSNHVQRFLESIPQYTRMGRHARAVIQHGTPRKWANLALVEAERMLHRISVKGRPYILFLDPCNVCNLRCPLCPTGMLKLGREQGMMSLDCFKRYLDPHVPYLFEVNCHNWGESMINESIFDMIAYAQSSNVGTNMSSNLAIATDNHLDGLVEAGLEHLTVSVDGADEESYLKYRVRGKFDRVINNMAKLVEKREANGGRGPYIEWQYIVMRHNEDKVEEAQRIAKEIGIDRIRFIPVGLPYEVKNRDALAEEWFPRKFGGRDGGSETPQTFGQADRPAPCYYLYRSMVINTDGGISPCCIVYEDKRDFDNLERHPNLDIPTIWNNEKFRSARAMFTNKEWQGRARTVCDNCDIFKRHESKLPHNMVKVRRAQAEAARAARTKDNDPVHIGE